MHSIKTYRYRYRQANLDGSHKIVYVTECLNVSGKKFKILIKQFKLCLIRHFEVY